MQFKILIMQKNTGTQIEQCEKLYEDKEEIQMRNNYVNSCPSFMSQKT